MANVIEVNNVYKAFGKGESMTKVLSGASLSVGKGEFVSLMGASGSGKSTLLYLIGGLDRYFNGTISVCGNDIGKMKEKALSAMRLDKIGFIFQFYNLVQNLNVEDNIALPLMLSGKKISAYRDKINECLEIIGMKDKRKLTPRELSGGQQQRVAIARSLVFDPDIIFLDEPIGNLDSKTGMKIMQLFKDINRKYDKTIVQVTHSEEAAKYGTKLIRIVDGEIASMENINRNIRIA